MALDGILDRGAQALQWDIRITIALSFLGSLLATKLVTTLLSAAASARKGDDKSPPMVPYSTPFLGNVVSFAFDTCSFLGDLIKAYGPDIPVRIRVLNQKIHFVSGVDNVLAMFKKSRDLTTSPSAILVLENAFGFPTELEHVLTNDKTGVLANPLPGSDHVKPQNRIWYLTHKSFHQHLAGASLEHLSAAFMKNLEKELRSLDFNDEWTDVQDLYEIIQHTVFKATSVALCGPHLLKLNPDLAKDFWEFDSHVPRLFKNLPRWMIPKAFRVRDKLLESVKKWQNFANEHYDWSDKALFEEEEDEYFGSRLMRGRYRFLSDMDDMTETGKAAEDLGMLWGANANTVPIVGWMIIDTLLRPELLTKTLAEIKGSSSTENLTPALSIPSLLKNPLIQSIYAEELRVRTSVMIQRVPIISNFKIGNWLFPKDKMIIASSWHEQHNREVWNEGPVNGDFHSVDEFWAERFLVYPNDPSSGPRKPDPSSATSSKSKKSKEKDADNKPYFTTDPVAGSFIPYGGGTMICPGRFYAKQEAVGALALFLTVFEIELVKTSRKPEVNMDYFPFGVIPPKGKFPARIRRRSSYNT